jgi:hypothetical protein
MNKRVPAGHFRRLQHNRVGTGSSERTTSFDRVAFAVGCFQPCTFFWGCAHAEASYQKQPQMGSIFQTLQIPDVVAEAPLLGLVFFHVNN